MILSPIPAEHLDAILARFAATLGPAPIPLAAWRRITASRAALVQPDEPVWHAQAVALADRFGMAPILAPPQDSFSWDGMRVCALSEPAVLLHEVAHYQLASPARRSLPDFGLGAGPETGWAEIADRARCVDDAPREVEEQMASLLGILWEAELGQPGILAFQEQNWLEGAGRPGATDFFSATIMRLHRHGLIDDQARPLMILSIRPDLPAERQAAA